MSDAKPVALSTYRDDIIERLTEHVANDHLSMEEFEERVDRVHRATSIQALDQLVSELEVAEAPTQALVPRPADSIEPYQARPQKKHVVAVMGGVERKGRWIVPRELSVTAIMGGADLDFREAVLAPGVTEIRVCTIMGGVDILVPPNVAVEADGIAILGGFDELHRAPPVPDPDRPLLRIKGFALMGGLDIKTRFPGESWWQARKRERKERQELRDRHPRELGKGRPRELDDGSDH